MTPSDDTACEVPASEGPFPFMRLPTELRVMVYKYHFLQTIEHSSAYCHTDVDGDCRAKGPILHRSIGNKGVNLGNLWITSKTIYMEAMPLYFSTHEFHFSSINTLARFLTTIPYHHRQHITKLAFHYNKTGHIDIHDVQQAFILLSECPNLTSLRILIEASAMPKILGSSQQQMGLKFLCRVRGIAELTVEQPREKMPEKMYHELFVPIEKRLAVLRKPYPQPEIRRHEARGITKETVARTCFTSSEMETPTARYPKRN
ncbi:MAG: hypothetical protein Q9169_001238 [Polycauliona sp. 2 TL-2023]